MDLAPIPKRRQKLQQIQTGSESTVDEQTSSTIGAERDELVVLQNDGVRRLSSPSSSEHETSAKPTVVTFNLNTKQESSSVNHENDLRVKQNLKNEIKGWFVSVNASIFGSNLCFNFNTSRDLRCVSLFTGIHPGGMTELHRSNSTQDSLDGKSTEISKVLNEIKTDVISIHQEDSGIIPEESLESPEVTKPQILIKDSYYIQQRNRFIKSSHPYADLLGQSDSNLWLNPRRQDLRSPLDAAIFFQTRIISPFCSICHGLLAGVAAMQLFLAYFLTDGLHNSQNFQEIFFKAYQEVSLAGPSCFAFLSSVCFVSILDRIDLFHLGKSDLRDWISYRRVWIIGLIYFCGLLVNAICFKYDNMIWHYQPEDGLVPTTQALVQVEEVASNRNQSISLDLFMPTWQILNAARCVCAISGWVLLSFAQPEDLLAAHLEQVKSFEKEVEAISTIETRG